MRLNKRMMKLNKSMRQFCDVKLLYVVLVVFVINFLQFVNRKDYESIFLVISITAAVYLFNKNMTIVLLIPLIFVNILIFMRLFSVKILQRALKMR